MGRAVISSGGRILRRAILTGLVVPLATLVACNELPTERIASGDPLEQNRPEHAGGGKGGDGDDDAPRTHTAQVIDAGSNFPGNSVARGIDDSDVVVGYARGEDHIRRAFHWHKDVDDDLQFLLDPNLESSAVGIHAGRIAGWVRNVNAQEGFVFYDDDDIRPLLVFDPDEHCDPSFNHSNPVAVAARGVAGNTSCSWRVEVDGEEEFHRLTAAVVWLTGGYEPVRLPSEGLTPEVRDINDEGRVVGTVQNQHMIVWDVHQNGDVTGPAVLSSGNIALPHAINNNGDVVGQIATHDVAQLVTSEGGVLDLHPLHSDDDSVSARALTDRTEGEIREILVVGYSGERPVLWKVNATDAANLEVTSVIELELPEGRYKAAFPLAINSKGVISGFSNTQTRSGGRTASRSHATVWWPEGGTD
jgi:hypothetical protein